MSELPQIIQAEITASGPLSFARFMELAPYHPVNRRAIGDAEQARLVRRQVASRPWVVPLARKISGMRENKYDHIKNDAFRFPIGSAYHKQECLKSEN